MCGLSDVLDGAIARRTGTVSRFGERLEGIKVPAIILTCILATFAAIQEGHLIRTEGAKTPAQFFGQGQPSP
ncbi:MAG: CDP-alcohol phosphatidyltransferase family protein [Candidatus Cryptobacteroides sp.]